MDPHLPHWLPDVTLHGLEVGSAHLDIKFWREKEETRWEVLNLRGELTVEQRPWLPWDVTSPSEAQTRRGAEHRR